MTGEVAAEWVPIDSIKPWDKNPRKNDGEPVDRVAKSIERFGFAAPIVVRAHDNRIIAGHTRWKAAQKLGMTQVPVRFMPLDEDQAAALALADNRLTEITPWDDEALAGVLRDLEAAQFDLDGLGWTAEELEGLMGLEDERPEPTDDLPEVQAEVFSAVGEVYELGVHRLVCGDCRDPEVVARLLGGRAINVAFTSPPYASQRKYDESSGFKPIPPDEYVDWFEAVQANVRAHLAPDGSWLVNIKEHCEDGQRSMYVKDLTLSHVRRWGWRFIDEFCWIRGGVPGKWDNRFKNAWEPVFHLSLGREIKLRHENVSHESMDTIEYSPDNPKTHSGFVSGSAGGRRLGLALPSNVVKVQSGPSQIADDPTKHTATYPVGLPLFFVKAFTDEGDAVYDPFMGSGTTLVAAAQVKRIAYGCEISPAYCDLIRRRWTRYAREAGIDPGPGALEG